MQGAKRIIPCLDLANGRVVKGVRFVDLRDAGDPAEAALGYQRAGADELVMLDIHAANEGRATMLDVIARVAERVTLPFTVGGGIRDVEQIEAILRLGAAKVSLNTAALQRPELIAESASRFGSGRIVAAIDVKRGSEGGWTVVSHGGQVDTGRDAVEWAVEAACLGAGEILLTSMDGDGAQAGYDIGVTRAVADAVAVPVVASGGAGSLEHFYDAIVEGHADAVLAASLFHFGTLSIPQVKRYLADRGVAVRLAE